MAEHTINSVASAVTNELTNRVLSRLIQRFGKQSASSEKLQRLEMLLIKVHSAVEASEKRIIKNLWLRRWHDKLKEAASQGDKVLASFRRRTEDAEAASANANQQQGEASSSPGDASATATGALSFTRNSLFGMVQGIRNASQVLFSGDEDMEKLNNMLARFEKLSSDIEEFIRLLQFEAPLPKVDQTTTEHVPTKKRKATEIIYVDRSRKSGSRKSSKLWLPMCFAYDFSQRNEEKIEETPAQCINDELRMGYYALHSQEVSESIFSTRIVVSQKEQKGTLRDEQIEEMPAPLTEEKLAMLEQAKQISSVIETEQQGARLQDRLKAALTEICNAVAQADSHDIQDLEWLGHWAGILREAKEQGCTVLGVIRASKTVNAKDNEVSMVECGQEIDALDNFVHTLEGLARDVEYFSKLVDLYPAC